MLRTRRIFWITAMVGILVTGMLGGVIYAQESSGGSDCPRGQGYWKNTAAWPVNQLVIGAQTYTQAELLILFNLPVAGDASLNLAHQLIAAKLNLLNGANATLATDLVTQADALLAAYPNKLPFAVDPASAQGQLMVNLAGVLESYNGGLLTMNCAPFATLTPTFTPTGTLTTTPDFTPTVTPTGTLTVTPATATPIGNLPITIVIEGPVQAINVNIITIYNINIQLADDDPNLTIIRVGDIVRVAGNTQTINNTIIIVAVNIIIINVDINVDTGEQWRDDNNCSNPPPPWAPAHGWRRRCEGQGGGNDESSGSGS